MGPGRPKGETLAEIRTRDGGRMKGLEEKMKREECQEYQRVEAPGRKRPRGDTLEELRRKEIERKRELAEKLKKRPSLVASSGDPCKKVSRKRETLAEIAARDRERKKQIESFKTTIAKPSALDCDPPRLKRRGDTLDELRRKNLEMKRQLKAKLLTRTPPHLRGSNPNQTRPVTAGVPRPPIAEKRSPIRRPKTTATTKAPKPPSRQAKRSSEQDEINRLKQEVMELKQTLAETQKKSPSKQPPEVPPRPAYIASQRELTDPTFEGTRYLFESAYKSFGRIEAMCPGFFNDDIKRAAKVLIGLAAGFVPGTPYHSLYKRALEEKRHPDSQVISEQIVLRPGDIDPNATTIVKVAGAGDMCEAGEAHPQDGTVKLAHARQAPYSSLHINSLSDMQEEFTLPSLPDEEEDEMTHELREILETIRPPFEDQATAELRDVVGTIRSPKRKTREYGPGKPVSPIRDFEMEEDTLIRLNPTPESERKRRQRKQMKDKEYQILQRRKKDTISKLRRDAWKKVGRLPPPREDDCSDDSSVLGDLTMPVSSERDAVQLGPYGEELVQKVLPRSKFARRLGLEAEGQGADLCLGDRY